MVSAEDVRAIGVPPSGAHEALVRDQLSFRAAGSCSQRPAQVSSAGLSRRVRNAGL